MKFENLENGEYIINLSIEALSDTLVTAYTNHRRFLVRNLPMKKGERFSGRFAVALKDADFQKQPNYRDSSVEVTAFGDCTFSAEIEKVQLPVLFCLGDSTVCDQADFGKSVLERCCGWGQTLGMYLKDKYAVSNHAEQGTHTADCLGCHIKPVLSQIKKGDRVILQFGHNDQKQSFLKPWEGYRENLIKIADEVAARGGECIFCTPINRFIYENGVLNTYLKECAEAVKSAAEEKGIECIDLHSFTSEAYERLGAEAENLFYHYDGNLDRTHPNDNGGTLIGEYVASFL